MSTPAVLIERLPDHVTLVTINRPEPRNAVNGDVAAGLDAAITQTEADVDCWVVILTGVGNDAFSAGADLKAVSSGNGHLLRTERGGFAGFVTAPRTKPWIAAVNGPALAGGCELALACDLRVAVPESRFGLPEVKRGLIASAGGLYRLPRALPQAVALEMILTGDPIPAERAHALGMVNASVAVVDEDEAVESQVNVGQCGEASMLSVARQAPDLSDAELMAVSQKAQAANMTSEDFKEGPRAFIEKRAPRWTGR